MTDQARVLQEAVRSAAVTRSVHVGASALTTLPALVRELGGSVVVVADENTMRAAGRDACRILGEAGLPVLDPVVLAGSPRLKPHAGTAHDIALSLRDKGAVPIAVGSGVINDLAKYAAELCQVPYLCVATAASMDGYAASGAALLDDGFKRTLDCRPPVAVVADLHVVGTAPPVMAGWGYGDLAGKVVAGADWALADALGEEAIDPFPFALVQDNVRSWLAHPERVAAGEADALGGLMNGLLVSGFAMQAHGNSRPASGAEHLISHTWEMERLTHAGEPAAHGACVSIGTVAILALYDWLLAQDMSLERGNRAVGRPSTPEQVEAEIAAAFRDDHLAHSARTEMAAKQGRASRRSERLRILQDRWPALKATLRDRCVPAGEMAGWLRAAGAPSHPRDLGLPLSKLALDYRRARLIRRRYTILDLLDDLGWLDDAIAAVMAADGFWGREAAASKAAISA